MATYSLSNHSLVFESNDYTKLIVKQGNTTVANWPLDGSNWVKLEVANGNYVLTSDSGDGCYDEELDLDDLLQPIQISASGGTIGISDIRDMARALLTYHIDTCPIYLHFESQNAFHVKSPCGTGCSAPSTGCRSIDPLP